MDEMHLRILAPDGVRLDTMASYVNLPTPDGTVGILKNHAPMLCAVAPGSAVYRVSGEELSCTVTAGTARIENNEIAVMIR